MNKLKPCPFCGGAAHVYEKPYDFPKLYITCLKCGVQTPIAKMEQIVEIWNRRADADVPDTNVGDMISRQALINAVTRYYHIDNDLLKVIVYEIEQLPPAQPERKDLIQKFHDYQIEWLKSHYDIELEPQLEEMIIRFLHDTANCYMMEMDKGMRGTK